MRKAAVGALALASLVTACIQGTPDSDPGVVSAQLVQVAFTQISARSLGTASFESGGLPLLGFMSSATSACDYTPGTQDFVCAPISSAGLVTSISYQLLNGSGGPQSALDASTTDGVDINVTVNGTLLGSTSQITQSSEYRITGYQGSAQVLNGKSTIVDAGTMTVTLTNVALPPATNPYPLSGTLTTDLLTPAGHVTSTITFDGTSSPPIVKTDASGVVTHCMADLAQVATTACVI